MMLSVRPGASAAQCLQKGPRAMVVAVTTDSFWHWEGCPFYLTYNNEILLTLPEENTSVPCCALKACA